MKKSLLLTVFLLAAFSGATFAQAPAPVAAPDSVAQARMERTAADKAYNEGVKAAKKDRQMKIDAATEAAVNEAKAKGADPLVAKRDAAGKAEHATQKEYDAKVKALSAKGKAARAAADMKANE